MTGDVIDDFLYGINEAVCANGYRGVRADLDGDGTYDTMAVFLTITGEGIVQERLPLPAYWYRFSYKKLFGCFGPNADRGRVVIRFVDILAAGYDYNDPTTWVYKSIPAVTLKTNHGESNNGTEPNPRLIVEAYRELNQTDAIPGVHVITFEPPDDVWIRAQFSDTPGIKELYITSDYDENFIDELILYNTPQDFTYGARGAYVVLLLDTSLSMSWSPEGQMGVPYENRRWTYAKEAAGAFLLLLENYFDYSTLEPTLEFGIATFPAHPISQYSGCQGQMVHGLGPALMPNIFQAITQTLPFLPLENSTPLLAGVGTAMSILTLGTKKAIVLLTDGYHNCPSFVNPGDPEVTDLINRLNSQSIKVYTIGFGRPTDPDYLLLEALAQQTSGEFHPVTTPIDPSTWHAATALQNTYKNILVDALRLENVEDPYEIVSAGQKLKRKISICEHDQKVSFYLGWVKPQRERLRMRIRSSDGQPVPITGPEVMHHRGDAHEILTVKKELLKRAGKVGPNPWEIEIDGSSLDKGTSEKCQYCVISDSLLKMKTFIEVPSLETGKKITLKAQLFEADKPAKGMKDIYVKISRPQLGIGNWFSTNKMPTVTLKKLLEENSQEKLPPRAQKANYLIKVKKVEFPCPIDSGKIRLYDDGTHGDVKANDGIYTVTFTKTKIEGSYTFHFVATGRTQGGNQFKRERVMKKYLRAVFSPKTSNVQVKVIKIDDLVQTIRVVVTPMDTIGNYVGPGYAKKITIKPSWGKAISKVKDNVDGTYSQTFQVPTSVASKTELQVTMEGKTKSVKLINRQKK